MVERLTMKKMISIKSLFISVFYTSLFISCGQSVKEEKWRHVEISPSDGSQVVTIITKEDKRYIMAGSHEKIPSSNYLLLDLSKVDRLGDAISICWNEGGFEWKVSSTYATVIENKLDSTKFLYHQPLGKYGQPTSLGYTGGNCGAIAIREKRKPRGDINIKYLK